MAIVALAIASLGCVAQLGDFAHRDIRALDPSDALLLGRVEVIDHGVKQTSSVAIETSAKALGGYQLGGDGTVAWLTKRSPRALQLAWISESDAIVSLGSDGPTLAPAAAPEPIVYFGTIVVLIESAGVHYQLSDGAEQTLSQLAQINPSLVGRRYYHFLRGATLVVPGPPPVLAYVGLLNRLSWSREG